MQAGREHIVVGMPPVEVGDQVCDLVMGTLITGGHFMAASKIRDSLSTLLHLVMMEYVLTNVEHDGLWQIFVRVCAFWLHITTCEYYLR